MTDPNPRQDQGPGVMPAAFWSDEGGQAWAELDALTDRLNRPIGEAVVARAFPGAGKRVLDVGCGTGATTLEMARRLGPDGRCVGVDVSRPLLDIARDRARAEAVANAAFVEADAAVHPFAAGGFDALISRFGVMFFDQPLEAFAALRRATRPDGRFVFACWRSPRDNPLGGIASSAAAPWVGELPQPAPDAPGRFAFANPDRVRAILDGGGWRGIEITALDTPMPLTLEEAAALNLTLGPIGQALRRLDTAARAQVHEAVVDRLSGEVVDGLIPMTAACWLVEAQA